MISCRRPFSVRVILTPQAQQDIRETVMYIAQVLSAPQAALDLEESFRKEIKSLSSMPKRIRLVDKQPWKDAGVRRTRVKKYYVYFMVDDQEKRVKVIAVIYVGRDQEKQMADRKMDAE